MKAFLSIEELVEAGLKKQDVIIDLLKQLLHKSMNQTGDRTYDSFEVCTKYFISRKTLSRWIKMGLKYGRVKNKFMFSERDLIDFTNQFKTNK